nr:uncharacterized threonine-rich GPI-anchored glycoprotein PJ4664.02-like [Procambarus clarkii]
MSSTNSLRFNRSRSRTQTNGAMSKASECGMSTFPRMSRPHSIAGSKFSYLEGCPDKDQQLSSPISSSVTKYDIKKSTAVDTTDSPRNKKGHVSPIRSLIAGLNTVSLSPVSQQAAGHQGTTSPRDIIAIKREELRKVNLRPCSQRLPSPVSPLPSSEIKTANRPESPATEPSSSNMLDKNTFYRRRSSFESITEKESQSRKSPTPPPWKSALKKSIRKIPHEPEYLAPSLNKSQPASRPSPTSHSHKSQTWTTSSDQDENVKVKTPGSSESNCVSTLSDVQRTSLPECIFSPRPTPGRGIRSICQPQSEGCLQSVRKKRSVMKIETSKADENSTTVSTKSDKSKTTSSSSKSDSRTPISPSSKSDSTTHISLSSKSDSRTPISPSSKSDSTTPISSSSKSDSTTPISSSSKSDSIPTISPSSKSDSIPTISPSSKSDSTTHISPSTKSDSTTPISPSSKSDSIPTISPSNKSDSTTHISSSSKSDSTTPISSSSKSDSTTPISSSSKSDSTTPISSSSKSDSTTHISSSSKSDSTTHISSSNKSDSIPPISPSSKSDSTTPISSSSKSDSTTPISPSSKSDSIPPISPSSKSDSISPISPSSKFDSTTPISSSSKSDSIPPISPSSKSDSIPPISSSSKSDSIPPISPSSKSDSIPPISPSSKSDSTTPISSSSKSDSTTPISPSSKSDSTRPISPSSKSDSTRPIFPSSKSDSTTHISPSSKSDSTTPISSSSKSDSTTHISPSSKSDSTTPISSSSKSDSTTPIFPSSKSDSTTPISLSSKSHSTRPISPSSKSDSTTHISPSSKSDPIPTISSSSKSDSTRPISSSSKSDSTRPISSSSKSDSIPPISSSSKSDSIPPISSSSKSDSIPPISSSSKSDSIPPISSSSKSDSIPPISPSSKSDSTTPISSSSKSDSTTPISPSSKSDSTTPISPSSKSDSTTPIFPSSESDSTTPISLSSKSHSTRPISPSSKSDSTRPISPSSKSDSTTPISPSPVIKEEDVLADIILSPEDLMSPTSTSMSSSLTDADMEVLELLSHHEQFCPIQTFSPDTDDQSIVFILNQDVEGNINPEIESSRNETDIQKHFREDLLLPDDTDHTLCKISSEEDIDLEYVDSDSGGQSPDVSEQRTPSVCRMIEHFAQRIQEQQELLERPPSPKRDIIRRIFLHQTKEMCSGSHDAKQALTPQSTEGSNGLIPDNIKIGTTNLETGTKENICESTPEPSRLLTHEDSKDEETLKTKTDVETDIQPTLSSPRLSLRLQAASVEEPSPNLVNKMVEQFDQQIQAQSLPTSPTSSRPNSIASLIQQDMLRLYTTQSKVARLNDDTIENPSPIGEDFFEETTFEIYDDDDKETEDKSLEINNKIPSEPETSDSDDDVEATVQMGNQICVIPKRTVREIRPSVCDELRHEFLQKIRSLDDDLRSLEKKKYEERRNAMKDKRKDIQHEGKIVTDEFANVQSLYREPRPKDAKDVPYTELEDIEHIKDDSEYFPVSCSNEPTIALQVTQELTQLEPKNQTNSKISEDDTFTSNFSSSAYTEPRGSEDKNIEYSPTNSLQNKSVEHVIDSDESLHIMPTLKSSKTGGLDRLSFRNYVKSSIANETLVSESEQPSTCVLEHDTKVMEYTSSFEVSTDEYRADPESVEEAVEAISFLSSDDHRRSRMSQGFTFYTNESEVAEDQNCGDKYQATENKKHKYYTRRRTLPSVPSDIQHEDYDSHRGSSTASLRSCDDKECTDSMTAWEDDKDSFVIRGRAQARHSTQLHMRHVDEIKRCRHSDEKVFTYGTFDAPTETTKDVRRFTWGSLRRKKKQDYSKEKKEETKPGDAAYIKQDNLSSKVQSEKVNKGTAYNFFFDRKKNKFENDQFPGTPDNTRTNPSLYKNLTDSSSKDNTIPTIVSVLPKQRENEPTDVDSHFGRERQTYRSKMASELKPKLKKRIPFYRDSSSSSDNFSQSLLRLIAPAALEEKQLLSGGEDSPSIQGEASEVSEGEQNYSPEYPSSACVRSRDPWVRRDLQDTMVESASLSDEADVFSNDVSSSNDEISQVNHNGGVEVRPRAGVLKTGRDRSRDSRRSLRVSWGDLPERMDSPSQISDAEDHDDDNNDDYHEQDEHQQTQEHGPDKQDEKAYRVTQL